MPYWLLTCSTYGTWLPDDPRGSVTSVRDLRPGEAASPSRREHSVYGEPFEPANHQLHGSARLLLSAPPVLLTAEQAAIVVRQFVDTAQYRQRKLVAAAVMANHFHVVVGMREDVDPRRILTDFKAYASRGLNEVTTRTNNKWWTRNGSRRRILDQAALNAAVNYVLHKQPNPLAIWPE